MIAVILPSRGLIFSQTADEIIKNLTMPHKIFFSHAKPIPECFEEPTLRALADKSVTHLWFVEEDMILPPHVLNDMLDMDVAVVTANYPTTNKGNSSVLTVQGRLVYGGTGCTLVRREVFDELKKPYFRDDIAFIPRNKDGQIVFTAKKISEERYGRHDVNFFMNLYELGIPVHKLKYSIGQRKLVKLGQSGTNNGAHQIEEWTKVKKDRYFDLKKNLKEERTTKLVEVSTPTGNITTSRDHAKRLIEKGLAQSIPYRAVVIDWSDL